MTRIAVDEAGGPKVCAFVDMLGLSELGAALLAHPDTDSGYRVLVGSTAARPILFHDYSHHPRILNRELNSTAAGRGQIIYPTWVPIQKRLGLADFSPVNQDRAIVELLRECHAWEHIVGGDIRNAIRIASKTWASLPGAGAKLPNGKPQHENKIEGLMDAYFEALAKYV